MGFKGFYVVNTIIWQDKAIINLKNTQQYPEIKCGQEMFYKCSVTQKIERIMWYF